MQHPTFGWRTGIRTDFCRRVSYSVSPERWQCFCHRRQWIWTMQHPTFGWRTGIHPDFCRRLAYSASPEWWQCGCCRRQWIWTMQHPTFGWRTGIHPGFCRRRSLRSYSASPEWWQCGCCRRQYKGTMQHSFPKAGSLLHQRCDMWQGFSFATRFCAQGWCSHADLLDFGWGRTLSFDCAGDWFSLGDPEKDCAWIECEPLKSPARFARWAVVGQSLPRKSIGLSCWGESKHSEPTAPIASKLQRWARLCVHSPCGFSS